jgi:hypothetical protein
MITTYIFGAILVLVLGWFAYLSYRDEFYPLTALMILLMAFLATILVCDIFIKKEIKNHIEMEVVIPKNSELKVNFVDENRDKIESVYVQNTK